jgi:hypothetical protein
MSAGNEPVEYLDVVAPSTVCADAERDIERADGGKEIPAEGHIGAGAKDACPQQLSRAQFVPPDGPALKPVSQSAICGLEQDLRMRLKFRGCYESGDGHYLWLSERTGDGP